MKTTVVLSVTLCILLSPSALVAERACEPGQAPASTRAVGMAPAGEAPAVELLFYELPRGLTIRPDQMITVEVRVDGAPYLVETLRLLPGQAAERTVVELFSSDPTRIQEVHDVVRQGKAVEVEISIGGESTEILDLETLFTRSAGLLRDLPLPRSVESAVLATEPQSLFAKSTTCEDQCWDEQDWCYENRCDFGGPPSCYDACDSQLEDCLAGCEPPPPCEPTTEIVYVIDPVSYYSLGIDCFYDVYYPWEGWEFDEQVWTYKRTKKEITHNCDGTDTVKILEVTYFQDYCYQRWFWSCSDLFIRYRINNCWY